MFVLQWLLVTGRLLGERPRTETQQLLVLAEQNQNKTLRSGEQHIWTVANCNTRQETSQPFQMFTSKADMVNSKVKDLSEMSDS